MVTKLAFAAAVAVTRRARAGRLSAAAALAALGLAAPLATLARCSPAPSADVVTEPTSRVPSDVAFYTHVLYGGDDAYLVDGRWFRPATTGWVVFTREPLELMLIRRSLEPERASTWFGM